jgi:hypothetical protein
MQFLLGSPAGVLQPPHYRAKILYWDRNGWTIWHKRLEAGIFRSPFRQTGRKEIAAWKLGLLLEDIDPTKGRHKKHFALPAARASAESGKLEKIENWS